MVFVTICCMSTLRTEAPVKCLDVSREAYATREYLPYSLRAPNDKSTMDANVTTLQAALEAAVNRSVTLPVSERPGFIGRCLIASHYGRELPHSPESNITEDAAVLLRQMQELQTTLSAALNAAKGQPGWPLLAVGRHLTQLADVVIAPAAAPFQASPSTAITAGSMDSDAAAAFASFPTSRKYIDIRSIVAFAATNDFVFVKASHFLRLAAQPGGKFLRRQELPEDAIAGPDLIERWAAEVEHSVKLRAEFPDDGDDKELHHGMRFPPFVIISYAWQSAKHPDGDGRQLREVLAPAIEWYMSERAKYISGDVNAVKHSPAKERARIPAEFTAEGVDFGIFLDFSSIWQKDALLFDERETPDAQPTQAEKQAFTEGLAAGTKFFGGKEYENSRSAAMVESFRRALGSMDLLYSHQESVVWRMTRLLKGLEGTVVPYQERGWVSTPLVVSNTDSKLLIFPSANLVRARLPSDLCVRSRSLRLPSASSSSRPSTASTWEVSRQSAGWHGMRDCQSRPMSSPRTAPIGTTAIQAQ